MIDLPLEGDLQQRLLYLAPLRPRAAVIMLPGGSGEVGVERNGRLRHGDNFVVRTRAEWVARGYAVLIPDTIDRASLRGLRSKPVYARIVEGLAAYARTRVSGPVFLLGTSQGSIAAVNAAAHATTGLIAGIVLTEPVSVLGGSGETVFDADPQDVSVPVLVVANRDDACDVAPPSMAAQVVAAMRRSPDARVVFARGGVDRSNRPCGSLSPHGYGGVEAPVIAAICGWMRAHGG